MELFVFLMGRSYIFKHWLSTILIAAIVLPVYGGLEDHAVLDVLWLVPYFLIGGALFSLPTLSTTLFALFLLARYKVNIKWLKPILISLTVIGICSTCYILSKTMALELVLSYCVIAVICGLVFQVEKK
ncbi:hypothetical protein D7322_23645 [Sphingobacterium puteale]|uniref:Uncharacterized protein n=1 Tax=Sphingobacterium puteale TaxID=2420510 RepID=A0A420VS72_9SPHI|nr:hypothetical protein D7322_23645 [Sphingobacterium puteale]